MKNLKKITKPLILFFVLFSETFAFSILVYFLRITLARYNKYWLVYYNNTTALDKSDILEVLNEYKFIITLQSIGIALLAISIIVILFLLIVSVKNVFNEDFHSLKTNLKAKKKARLEKKLEELDGE